MTQILRIFLPRLLIFGIFPPQLCDFGKQYKSFFSVFHVWSQECRISTRKKTLLAYLLARNDAIHCAWHTHKQFSGAFCPENQTNGTAHFSVLTNKHIFSFSTCFNHRIKRNRSMFISKSEESKMASISRLLSGNRKTASPYTNPSKIFGTMDMT